MFGRPPAAPAGMQDGGFDGGESRITRSSYRRNAPFKWSALLANSSFAFAPGVVAVGAPGVSRLAAAAPPRIGGARRTTRAAPSMSRSGCGADYLCCETASSSRWCNAPSAPVRAALSASSTSVLSPIIFIWSWRRTGARGSRAACRGSPFGWPAPSTACSGGEVACGRDDTILTCSARRGRSGTLSYTCCRFKKHTRDATGFDSRSSAAWFQGWPGVVAAPLAGAPVVAARTWLARVGWRLHGSLDPTEAPRRR